MNAVSMPRVSKLKSNFYWVSFWVCILLLLTFSLKCDVMRCSAGARQCCIATVKYSGSFSLYRKAVLCGGVIFELSFHMCGNKNREIFKFMWGFNYKTGIEDCITVFPFFLSELSSSLSAVYNLYFPLVKYMNLCMTLANTNALIHIAILGAVGNHSATSRCQLQLWGHHLSQGQQQD